MSVTGTKRTSQSRASMSALWGNADITWKRPLPFWTQLGHRFVQAATACRTADLRNFSALGVKQQPLTRPARLMVMRAAVSHSSIEIPAANTAIARCCAGFRSVHEILFTACPRDGFRLFLNYCLIATPTMLAIA